MSRYCSPLNPVAFIVKVPRLRIATRIPHKIEHRFQNLAWLFVEGLNNRLRQDQMVSINGIPFPTLKWTPAHLAAFDVDERQRNHNRRIHSHFLNQMEAIRKILMDPLFISDAGNGSSALMYKVEGHAI